MMNAFKEHGVVSEDEEEEGMEYDNGLAALLNMKDKKKAIKVNNRFFGDLEM